MAFEINPVLVNFAVLAVTFLNILWFGSKVIKSVGWESGAMYWLTRGLAKYNRSVAEEKSMSIIGSMAMLPTALIDTVLAPIYAIISVIDGSVMKVINRKAESDKRDLVTRFLSEDVECLYNIYVPGLSDRVKALENSLSYTEKQNADLKQQLVELQKVDAKVGLMREDLEALYELYTEHDAVKVEPCPTDIDLNVSLPPSALRPQGHWTLDLKTGGFKYLN